MCTFRSKAGKISLFLQQGKIKAKKGKRYINLNGYTYWNEEKCEIVNGHYHK